MNSGWKAYQAADELEQTTAEAAKLPSMKYAVVVLGATGPVLKCYADGELVFELNLTHWAALQLARTTLQAIRL